MKVLSGGPAKHASDDAFYQDIVNQHLQYIEKQCFKAIRSKLGDAAGSGNPLNIENEALELNNMVLDTLQKNNCRVLREFKGNSRVTTYITAIISRHAVDMIRKKLGRDRRKDRAKELGDIGLTIYQLAVKDGCPIAEVLKELQANHAFTGSLEELETMLQKITGKNPAVPNTNGAGGSAVKTGTTITENEYVIPDTTHDPQELTMENQQKQKRGEVVRSILSHLTGEERILLRMRFPVTEGKEPEPVSQVAAVLGISQKAVYKRVTRLMKKCKDLLEQQGVTVHDLL